MSSIPIVEEEELHPHLLSKGSDVFISSQLNSFLFKEDYNNELEELIFQLVKYKKELNDAINEGKKRENENDSIKKALYLSLESMLIQASYITSDKTRHDYINQLYKWYREKLGHFISVPQQDIQIKTYKNSQDVNVDDEWEYKHRTRHVSATSLIQYRTKKISKKRLESTKVTQDGKQTQTKQKDIFALTKGSMKSTFYTSLQGGNCYATSDKLKRLTLQEILKENKQLSSKLNIPIQENKSSYSILRPPFKCDLLILEKEMQKQKNKELKNKRTSEEIRSMAHHFGSLRAQYIGAMNKKYEMRKMLENHHYNNPTANKLRNKSLSESFILSSKASIMEQQEESKKKKDTKKKKLSKTVILSDIKQNKNDNESNNHKEEIESYLNKGNNQSIDYTKKLHQHKIWVNSVRNRKGKSIIKEISPEKSIDLKVRLKLFDSKQYIVDTHKQDMDELPNDCISRELSLNQIFRTRNLNKSLIDLREINNRKDGYLNLNNNPLSLSDISHIDLLIESRQKNNPMNISKQQSLNSIDYAKNIFQKMSNDYLLLRKTMANKKKGELTSLNKSMHSKTKKKLNKSALYQAYVNPFDENSYPATYLPHSGSGLLVTPYVSYK